MVVAIGAIVVAAVAVTALIVGRDERPDLIVKQSVFCSLDSEECAERLSTARAVGCMGERAAAVEVTITGSMGSERTVTLEC